MTQCVKPTCAQHVFDAVDCFDDYVGDWARSKGPAHWEGHRSTVRWDLDEAMALDTTVKEVRGLPWILDVFERLGGALSYATSPLRWPRLPWYSGLNRIPTDAEVEELADRIGRNPKTEVDRAIVVCIFERLPLPWRVRLAKLISI